MMTREEHLAAENKRLRKALEPFVAEKLPSMKRTEIGYDRYGLRRLISRFELAQIAALAALSEPKEQTTADGWIEWKGGPQPVPDSARVSIRFKDGDELTDEPASFWHWDRSLQSGDWIVAYRVVSP